MVFLALSAASALLLAVLALVLWERRPSGPLWPVVFACQLFAFLWVFGDLWASNASTLAEKHLAFMVLFTGSIPIVPAWWETTRRYVKMHGLGRPWMDSFWATLPLWFGSAAWLMAMTNLMHGQFITPVVEGRNVYQWGIISVFYAHYATVIATVGLSLWAAVRHSSPDVRHKLLLLSIATAAPAAANVVHLVLPEWPREDITSVGLGFASLVVVYGILRVRLFNPMPVSIGDMLKRVPAGLLVLDRGGRLIDWNPAAERLLKGIDLEPDMRLLRTLARVLKDGNGQSRLRSSRELTALLTKDDDPDGAHVFRFVAGGEDRWIDLALTPIPDPRQGLAAVCLRVADVTELRRLAREREQLAEQMRDVDKLQSLGRMAGGVAHDFNNLLTSIVGNTHLALEELPPGNELRDYLEEIRESAHLAAELTEQLLAYAGRSELITEPVSLSNLVEDMGLLVGSSFARHVELRTHLQDGIPPVVADPTQLRQIVLNLVANAAEAIENGEGYVTIRTASAELNQALLERNDLREELRPGPHALLEVHDSGVGMDEETRRRIFEPFFTSKSRGRGLGLAAVFGIVRAHKGAISVMSEPGRGSTFRVWLPLAKDIRTTFERPPQRVRSRLHADSPATILVVDDQQRVRRIARRVLSRAGHTVLLASDGRQAVQTFRKRGREIDLVLLDLTMPEMGGEEALREMREIDPEIQVILMSGYDETNAMKRLAGEKLGGFLHKPWEPSALLEAVARVLYRAD